MNLLLNPMLFGGITISAAGDEVEIATRRVLAERLPAKCRVSHGHVIDSQLSTSPQLDLIITDASKGMVLAGTNKGSEYIPYENVYAIGEVKATYYKGKHYVKEFALTLDRIRTQLKRAPTPPNYIGDGPGFTTDSKAPYRNPLMSFMIFVKSNDFSFPDLYELYSNSPVDHLPNFLCFLDQGIVLNALSTTLPSGQTTLGAINLRPGFSEGERSPSSRWSFVQFGEEETRPASNFGFLVFALTQHISSCVLQQPDILAYFGSLFRYSGGITMTE